MNFKSSITALVFMLLIPVIGYLISNAILNDLNSDVGLENFSVVEFCNSPIAQLNPEVSNDCNQILYIYYLKLGSIICGIVSISLVALYIIFSLICGTNRKLISIIFPILVPTSTLIISVLILVQGVIITYGAYVGEGYAIGRVHFVLIGGIGLGAAVGSLKLLSSLFSIKTKPEMPLFAKEIKKSDDNKIWLLVKDIANKLNSREPDNIIVGLEPTFYATSANIKLINDNKSLKVKLCFYPVLMSYLVKIN